jgi:hypothetical protein
MFEVIISTVQTGHVRRKLFATREQADQHIEKFLHGGKRPRCARDYRVEVYPHDLPVVRRVRPAGRPTMNPAA